MLKASSGSAAFVLLCFTLRDVQITQEIVCAERQHQPYQILNNITLGEVNHHVETARSIVAIIFHHHSFRFRHAHPTHKHTQGLFCILSMEKLLLDLQNLCRLNLNDLKQNKKKYLHKRSREKSFLFPILEVFIFFNKTSVLWSTVVKKPAGMIKI